jgi:predicted murein hydrolase (TIGR00659 family)
MMQALTAPLIHHPLFYLGLTLLAFQSAAHLNKRTCIVFLQPVLVSAAVIIGILTVLGVPYVDYFQGVTILSLLLGPATVALAIPLYQNMGRIRRLLAPILITVIVGGCVATGLSLALARLLGIDHQMIVTLAPKSVTSPIAMLVANQAGGVAALAAVFVLITGILGAVGGPPLLKLTRVTHPAAMGIALGVTAHAVGTSRALEEGQTHGAYAALGMSLMGVLTALLLPMVLGLI